MEYHKERFEDSSILIFKNQKLIALFPANQVNDIIYSHQGLTYGGLITSEIIKLKDVIDCFKLVLSFYKNNGCNALEIKQLPSIYTTFPSDEIQYLMFILEATLKRRDTLSVLNLNYKM
ncbi:MAG: GNAT family N-acetyltransferase, partial [Bacteroidetes bacterium]